MSRDVVRGWIGLGVLVAAAVLFLAYAYPGYMSFDSGWQLREARSGQFTDWHPPLMAEIWRQCDRIVSGPLLMLLLQSVAFTAGVYLLVRKRRSIAIGAIAAGVLLVFPPIATTLAVIWKDSQMLGFLMLGTALLAPPSGRRGQVAGCAVLGLATAMRHNAFTITFAIVVLLLEVPARTRVRRYAAATAIWLAITVAAFGTNTLLTVTPMYPWHGSLAIFDVLGTLHYARPLPDAEIRDTLRGTHFDDAPPLQARVDAAYSPFLGIFRDLDAKFLAQPTNATERDAIARAFETAITEHPAAYLSHRWHEFREVLQLTCRHYRRVWIGFDDSVGFSHAAGPVQRGLRRLAVHAGQSWLFWPFLYALAAIALGVLAVRRRDILAFALVASALLSEATLFVLAPTPDFRYSIWLVTVAVLVPWLIPWRSEHLHGDNSVRLGSAARAFDPP